MKKRSILKKVGLTLAGLGAVMSGSAIAKMQVESHGGLTVFDPADGSYWFKIGGLLQVDEVVFSGNTNEKRNDFPNGINFRRAWLNFRGGVGDCWSYMLTLDFRGDPVVIRDAFIKFSGIENTNLAIGQFFIPFGLENFGLKRDLLFLEQSLMGNAFMAPEYGLGIYADTNFADMFTFAGAVYQPRQVARTFGTFSFGNPVLGQTSNSDFVTSGTYVSRDDRFGEAARITISPIHCEDMVVHFGGSIKNQALIDHDGVGNPVFTNIFQTVPEAQARITALLVNAGPIHAKGYTVGGLEAAGLWGPAMLQAEYNQGWVRRTSGLSNLSFHGWHVQGSWVLTGESHTYDFPSGTFGGICPDSECGAWELAARVSRVNLNDKDVYGGKQEDFTLGVNWYFNENVRLMFNYIWANIRPTNTNITQDFVALNNPTFPGFTGAAGTPPTNVGKRHLDIFGARLQVAF